MPEIHAAPHVIGVADLGCVMVRVTQYVVSSRLPLASTLQCDPTIPLSAQVGVPTAEYHTQYFTPAAVDLIQ